MAMALMTDGTDGIDGSSQGGLCDNNCNYAKNVVFVTMGARVHRPRSLCFWLGLL